MNGRVYNPTIARFVSAEPLISRPDDTQSYNRYSYVSNRPMFYTDPSGFSEDDKETDSKEPEEKPENNNKSNNKKNKNKKNRRNNRKGPSDCESTICTVIQDRGADKTQQEDSAAALEAINSIATSLGKDPNDIVAVGGSSEVDTDTGQIGVNILFVGLCTIWELKGSVTFDS